MRQLATLPSAEAARTLADHLQTLSIETRLEPLADGWAIWVCDEDRLPQAKAELADFAERPDDPRYLAARKAATVMRRRAEREAHEETAPQAAAPSPSLPGTWTLGLILTCVLVFLFHAGWLIYANRAVGQTAALNVLVWWQPDGLEAWTSPAQQALSFGSFLEVPGGRYIPLGLSGLERGEVWRLVTPIFLHFGVIHLLFNMMWLHQLGTEIEGRRGAGRYLLLVLACAVLGNVGQYFLGGMSWQSGHLVYNPNPLFGGMSGVVYGLFGYVWMKVRYEPQLGLTLGPRTVFWMIAWLILCTTGAVGPVANVAHVVGLLVGVVTGATPHLWRRLRATRPR